MWVVFKFGLFGLVKEILNMNIHGRLNLYFIKEIKTNPVCYYVSYTTTSYILSEYIHDEA